MNVQGGTMETWKHVVAGTGARCCVETFMSPFHLIRVRLQYSSTNYSGQSLPSAMWQIAKSEGLGMWKGLPPRLVWVAPLSSGLFVFYEMAREVFSGEQVSQGKKLALVAAPAALGLATVIRTPFDIVEQRLQLTGLGSNQDVAKSPRQYMKRIWQEEGTRAVLQGGLATFCVGASSHCEGRVNTVQMSLTFMTSYFVVYESSKALLISKMDANPTSSHLAAGGVAGAAGAIVATPFDCIKTRMQTLPRQRGEPFPTMRSTARELIEGFGWKALMRGVKPRVAAFTPAGALTFGSYELFKSWLR